MCGIFGAYNVDREVYKDDDFIKAIEKVAHRGPDNISYLSFDNCFLGHARLSIIDVGETSNQPFEFDDLVMIFNGEVFNYIELAEELRQKGYTFNTSSDTEVVIKSFHCWGVNCFSKFNGMWAIVIYNKKINKIIISKDRFGQKPLFVLKKEKTILFSSEFQQLVRFSDREINYPVIQKFLEEGAFIHDNQTFYKDIEIFPKASYVEINTEGALVLTQYWQYWHGAIKEVTDGCFREFESLLEDSIKIRLRADVTFCVLLSGGVDSTLIAAYIRKNVDKNLPILAFTYASQDTEDESQFAISVARKLNLSLTIERQEHDPENYLARLKQLVTHFGRGHSSLATVSADVLLESAFNKGCKIAIDGQGADELLAGYKTYYPLAILVSLVKCNFKQAMCFFKSQLKQGFFSTTTLYLRNIFPERLKVLGRFLYGHGRFLRKLKCDTFVSIFGEKITPKNNINAINRYLIAQHNLGLENLLFYGDIVAMKNSIENRSPFLDHRLVDFVFSRSDKIKLWNGLDKYALRKLPVYSVFREELDRDKIGFSSDISRHIKQRMIENLQKSKILEWKIFNKRLKKIIVSGEIIDIKKYETFFFRLYQVHLWDEIFNHSVH